MNQLSGLLLAIALAACSPLLAPRIQGESREHAVPAWPHELDGKPLVSVNLGEDERRLLGSFPGAVARFSDGERELLMRWVTQPTRRLHPAEDCYRGWGFEVAAPRVRAADDGSPWRCFTASRSGETREVCEQIRDSDGRHFTDVSSWYWAATLDPASRPWLVTTVAKRLPGH